MAKQDVSTYVSNRWWLLTVHGILAILFGIAAVFWPGITLVTLVYLFGAYIIAAGILGIINGLISIGERKTWILTLLLGVLELGVGIYLIRHPLVSFATLVILIGFTLIFFGLFEAIAALAEKDLSATHRTLTLVSSVVAVLAGVLVLMQPAATGVAFVWILGVFALINGPISIAISLDAKHLAEA